MKVITKGIDKKFIIVCGSCQSTIEFTIEDTFEHEIYFGTYMKRITSITCPVCNKIIKAL